MQVLRQVHKVKNGTLTIELPADFHEKEVEVIVRSKGLTEVVFDPAAIQLAIQDFLAIDTSSFTRDQQMAYNRTSGLLAQKHGNDKPRVFGLYAGLGTVADDFDSLSTEKIDLFYADNIFPEHMLKN